MASAPNGQPTGRWSRRRSTGDLKRATSAVGAQLAGAGTAPKRQGRNRNSFTAALLSLSPSPSSAILKHFQTSQRVGSPRRLSVCDTRRPSVATLCPALVDLTPTSMLLFLPAESLALPYLVQPPTSETSL
jgi:hypothetical protein